MSSRTAGRILSVLAVTHKVAARSHPGQVLAPGQAKVSPGTQIESSLFVALQSGPVVDAEELFGGHAVQPNPVDNHNQKNNKSKSEQARQSIILNWLLGFGALRLSAGRPHLS